MARRMNGLLLVGIYVAWAALTWFHALLPFWIFAPLGAGLLAWHSSFQHEAIHDHIATRRWLNDGLASVPLSLWLPYPIYRKTHRAHHRFEILTDPRRDPESYYVDQLTWARLPRIFRTILTWYNTLSGRLLLGPFLTIAQFLTGESRALARGDHRNLAAWLWHVPAVALVLTWVIGVCGLSFWHYLFLLVMPGASLILIRSFAEHKALHTPFERTAIVEAGPFFSLLFLNNNLHFAHHRRPDLPWQVLPAYYRAHRRQLLAENGGLCYRQGYLEIARRFLFQPVDKPEHPFC